MSNKADNPQSDTAFIWLAQVLNSLGRKEDALRAVREALRLNPKRLPVQKRGSSHVKRGGLGG
jgi:cytochrome c-type biogenesis protein CcmH/NrfG